MHGLPPFKAITPPLTMIIARSAEINALRGDEKHATYTGTSEHTADFLTYLLKYSVFLLTVSLFGSRSYISKICCGTVIDAKASQPQQNTWQEH
jgi:hypothetical protein